jgi:hypothetical protein
VVWASIHLGATIICACLPLLRPLIVKWCVSLTSFPRSMLSGSISGLKESNRTRMAPENDAAHASHHQQQDDQIRLVDYRSQSDSPMAKDLGLPSQIGVNHPQASASLKC